MSHNSGSMRRFKKGQRAAGLIGLGLMALLLIGLVAGVAQAGSPQSGAASQLREDGQPTPAPQPQPVIGTSDQAQPQGTENSADNENELLPAEIKQLQDIQNKTITGAQLDQLKAAASEKIVQYGPLLLDKLDDKAKAKQEQRLAWVAVVIMGVIPALALLTFLLYPLVRRKAIKKRVPNATTGQLYRLYIPQALLVTLVLVALGTALWGVQFLTGRVLGGVTNPQLVLQRQAITYLIDDHEYLINNYTELFVGLADDIQRADPEKPVFDIILENALQLKNDPLVSAANEIIKFVMPFLNYISLVTFGILVLFFLIRIRPDLARLLTYPVDILASEQNGEALPDFDSVALGLVAVKSGNGTATMRQIGQRLMWNEVKVIALFALAVLAAAVVMSFALVLFFGPIVQLLVGSINDAAEYFLTTEGASSTLTICAMVLMVFVVECIVVLLLTFTLVLIKWQDALRQRFAGRISWKQTGQFMTKVGLRFGWLMILVGAFGFVLPLLAEQIDKIYNDPNSHNDELVSLLVIPITLLIGFNLGLWLLRGFRMLGRLITKSASAEFGLKKPNAKKDLQPVAP